MTQLVDVIVPEDQQEGTESVLAAWLARTGDFVKQHQPLVELSTDKAVVEISAPISGVLQEVLVEIEQPVKPGMLLGRIMTSESASDTPQKDNSPQQTTQNSAQRYSDTACFGNLRVSPAVRRYAAKYSVDLTQIKGSGHAGRVTKQDLFLYLDSQKSGSQSGRLAQGIQSRLPEVDTSSIPSHRVPHTLIRKKIAQHMSASLLEIAPHVTSVFECNMSAVIKHRNENKQILENQNRKLTFTAYFLQAAAKALEAVPEVNSRWHDDALEVFDEINIVVGTALDQKGLVVPVLRRVNTLDLIETAARLHDLTEKARAGRIEAKDLSDGTFTISNHGVSGSLFATPIIINQPQSAILGIGKLENRVKANAAGEVSVEPCIYVSLSIDHRVLDAFHTNAFLSSFVKTLESWE